MILFIIFNLLLISFGAMVNADNENTTNKIKIQETTVGQINSISVGVANIYPRKGVLKARLSFLCKDKKTEKNVVAGKDEEIQVDGVIIKVEEIVENINKPGYVILTWENRDNVGQKGIISEKQNKKN